MDWSAVDYLWIIVMFLSTLILTAPIHCRASIAETLMQCYTRNKLIYILRTFMFEWTIPLKPSNSHYCTFVRFSNTFCIQSKFVMLWFTRNIRRLSAVLVHFSRPSRCQQQEILDLVHTDRGQRERKCVHFLHSVRNTVIKLNVPFETYSFYIQ